MMGDFGKGIKSFKQGMNDEVDRPVAVPPARIAQQPRPAAARAEQSATMAYDPVSAPPTIDPAPPHPTFSGPDGPRQAPPEMPYDPVTAPAGDDPARG
jgi:hypothetical protein